MTVIVCSFRNGRKESRVNNTTLSTISKVPSSQFHPKNLDAIPETPFSLSSRQCRIKIPSRTLRYTLVLPLLRLIQRNHYDILNKFNELKKNNTKPWEHAFPCDRPEWERSRKKQRITTLFVGNMENFLLARL